MRRIPALQCRQELNASTVGPWTVPKEDKRRGQVSNLESGIYY